MEQVGLELQMNRLNLRNNRLKLLKTAGELPIVEEDFLEYYTRI